ncbi:MAG TPA: Uma2 family endonuclease [Blastocatellia bacterium]|nr:Uma2 family endonuclease [Blastocatellia bacterium]HMV83548.1 Uma2 family endonuclease [Blastocatellia bacterium]HMX26766.1 Uma2 family endonuclease [Blastocatellia bacterium]HMY73601.1 Uma2 family endonuclease [Blastocatellia bacterium]HMZ17259.1 Uma2 family endonuclease [Blastocatellia bacterium]
MIPSALADIDPSVPVPPTQDELPCYDGEPLESLRHFYQIVLLIETLKLHWADRQDYFVGGNMFVYFSTAQVKNNDFRGPNFMLATGVDGTRERKSWVNWEEGKSPDLVIEFLSESTADFDRGAKKKIYHDNVRVPEYFYYDPFTGELAGFSANCMEYKPIPPDEKGRIISVAAGLALTLWHGDFMGITADWLRWETIEGNLLPTKTEFAEHAQFLAEEAQAIAEEAQIQAEEAQECAKQERERAERLMAKLRELGVDPATLD